MVLFHESIRIAIDLLQLYLQEIGRIPLLNQVQELHHAQEVQALMQLQQLRIRLATQLEKEPTIAEWSDAATLSESELQSAIALGELAKRKLIEANLRFVVTIAKRYRSQNIELLDLIQEGSIGLTRGVEKFDPTKGYRLSTYAYWWIRQSITRTIALHSRTVRLPEHLTEKLNKIKKVQQHLTQQLGRTATIAEIAQVIDLPQEQIREYLSLSQPPLSLDQPISETQDTSVQERLLSAQYPSDQLLTEFMLQEDIKTALNDLPARERAILSLRYGLADGQSRSFPQIGRQLNLSRERVRQLERQAIEHLKRHQSHLRGYLIS